MNHFHMSWGSKVRDRLLHLRDGACLAVTENLEQLLPHVLRHCSTGYLWIDQICINQEDISERNHQVELMGDIYGGCKQVLVWLKDFLPVSVDAIHHVARLCHAANDTSVAEYTLIGKLHWMMFVDISEHSSLVLWQIFRYLCSSWFVRGWVYQEVVLAPVCRIILGHSTVSLPGLQLIWKTIWRTILRAQISPGFPPYDNKIVHGLKMIQKLNKDWEQLPSISKRRRTNWLGVRGLTIRSSTTHRNVRSQRSDICLAWIESGSGNSDPAQLSVLCRRGLHRHNAINHRGQAPA